MALRSGTRGVRTAAAGSRWQPWFLRRRHETLPPLIGPDKPPLSGPQRAGSELPLIAVLSPPAGWTPPANPPLGRILTAVLGWSSLLAAIAALGLAQAWLLSLATFLLAMALVSLDVRQMKKGMLTCGTTYGLLAGVPALANMIGMLSANSPERGRYFMYVSESHIYLASQLALANAIVPLLGFWAIWRWSRARSWVTTLIPPVRAAVSDRWVIIVGGMLGFLSIAVGLFFHSLIVSTFVTLLQLMPCVVVFVLARINEERPRTAALKMAAALMVAESLRAFLFSYLRVTIAMPYFAFAIGSCFGARSPRPLFRWRMVPVYAAVGLYALSYGLLGRTRQYAPTGLAKITYMRDVNYTLTEEERRSSETLVSRVSNFNQLSQIGRVVEEDGFYHGGTFSYVVFAFIPRFLWPEKPWVDRGTWFALRIGQARMDGDWANNTINMTQAGELYLNFGWPGVTAGLLLYGAFLGVLWTAARFDLPGNAIGSAFGFYLIWSTLGHAGDFTVVVTSIAMYLVFVATASAASIALYTAPRISRAPTRRSAEDSR